MLALAAAAALAMDDAEAARILAAALLDEAAYGNHEAALHAYQTIARERPLEDPKRADALFRLATVQASLGRLPEAGETLRELIRTGDCRAPCHQLLGEIELEAGSVRDLPVRWTFSTPIHGLFHPWEFDDVGSIRVQARDEAANPALIWRTLVDVRKADQLVVGFADPQPAPRTVAFRVQAEDRPAALRIQVFDAWGRAYGPPSGPIRVPTDRPLQVAIRLTDLAPADPEDPPLDPRAIARLVLEDASALSGTAPGQNALYLDDVAIE